MLALARSPRTRTSFRGESFPGIGSRPELTGTGKRRGRERNGKQREGPGHWLQTPWRRRDASQLLAKHILSWSHPGLAGAQVFFYDHRRWFHSTRGSPIKSRLLLAQCLRILLYYPPTSLLAAPLRRQHYRLNSGELNSGVTSSDTEKSFYFFAIRFLITRSLSIIMSEDYFKQTKNFSAVQNEFVSITI